MLFALIICIVVQAASFIAAFWLTLSTINTLKKKGNDTKGHDILYLMFAVLGVTILLTDLTLFLQVHQLEMVILTCFR